MIRIFLFTVLLSLSAAGIHAQVKGIDPQNRQIQRDANKGTDRGRDVSRSWDFGDGKTKTRAPLSNPQRLNGRRDFLIAQTLEILRELKMEIDTESSRISDGLLVSKPFVFARGAVIARSELARLADLPDDSTVWTRGRLVMTVEVQSLDGITNNVSVSVKIEGRAENGLSSEWNILPSSGVAEEEFLVKLVEMVTGKSPEDLD